jgi:hypothetical protein
MSEDDINFYVVMVGFTLLILYLNYVQKMTVLKHDWDDVKCNPLYLFVKSIGAPTNESSKDFQTCIAKYGGRDVSSKPCTPAPALNIEDNNMFQKFF